MKLISLILSEVYKEPELIITILQVLKDILPLVSRVGDDNTHLKYIKLMNEFRSVVIVKKCCGSKAVSKFIECIVEIFKQKEIWVILEKHDLYYAIFEDLLIFVKHPYHQVRLAAAQNLGLLFLTDKNMKKTALAWQKEMLKKLFVALRDNEDLYPKEKGCIKDYASRVLLSTSLLSLANVICLSRFWRKKAMFYLLHLVYLKNIERCKYTCVRVNNLFL